MLGEEGRTRSWDRSHRGTKVRDLKLSTVWKIDAEGQGWGEPRGSGGPRGSGAPKPFWDRHRWSPRGCREGRMLHSSLEMG